MCVQRLNWHARAIVFAVVCLLPWALSACKDDEGGTTATTTAYQIALGGDFPPYDAGPLSGLNHDILTAICEATDMECDIIDAPYTACFDTDAGGSMAVGSGLTDGTYDACMGWFVTQARVDLGIEFSDDYSLGLPTSLIVTAGGTASASTDLGGATVGILSGFFNDDTCLEKHYSNFTPEFFGEETQRDDALAALADGSIDYMFWDAADPIDPPDGTEYVGDPIGDCPDAGLSLAAFGPRATEIVGDFNTGLAAIREDGTLEQLCAASDANYGFGDPNCVLGPAPTGCTLDETADPVVIGSLLPAVDVRESYLLAFAQVPLAAAEVNDGCGVLGDANTGIPVEVVHRENEDAPDLTQAATEELVGDAVGAVAVIGGGGSEATLVAAEAAVAAGVPIFAIQGSSDALSGCTAVQLSDDNVEKVDAPVYDSTGAQCWDHGGLFFRMRNAGYEWGTLLAAFIGSNYDVTSAAHLFRDDSFGLPVRDGFMEAWADEGGTVTATEGHTNDTDLEDYKTLIQTLVADEPEIITGTTRNNQLKLFLQAWVELSNDETFAKPSNWDDVQFIFASTIQGDYSDQDDAVRALLADRTFGIAQYWDTESEGYQRWLGIYEAADSEAEVLAQFQPAAFDAVMVVSLAVTQSGSTDGASIATAVREVASGPGIVVYPDQYSMARELIVGGVDIDYEGATGSLDFDEQGNVGGSVYQLFDWGDDGNATEFVRELSFD